ncbi:zinc finger CCCH domain-containing protein 54 [Magnolia sinica]|uniref:zinc finger CCCH domain-containing protein 54 n=1 Tax=Magnolia sinica TaxID=86752 RepID=UPI002657E532|nr:zinc finger CCCH domain-containing protein 54 [Magnolia sinica]
MLKGVSQSFLDISKPRFSDVKPARLSDRSDAILQSDDFRMYVFKIKRCSKSRSHDWTECPYAHRGEKARRRDPRKFNYHGIACPEFRRGACWKGDTCEFAHGVFEFWLHPARYRTRACKAGRYCRRKVCFFAHTPEQLRAGIKYTCECVHRDGVGVSDGGENAVVGSPPTSPGNEFSSMGEWEFLEGIKGLKIGDVEEVDTSIGADMFDSPDIDWISELVN